MRYLVLILLLASCTPQKRLDRLIRRHPELVRVDSVKIVDTVITRDVSVDTMRVMNTHDTFIVNRDRLTVQVIRHQDSIYVFGKCAADTVVIERNVPVRVVEASTDEGVLKWLVPVLLVVIMLMLFARRIG